MKLWLPGVLSLFFAAAVHAEDYRVVYSPSLALEVFIDNVASKAPADWCQETLHLRIVSGKSRESQQLNSFLPRVGTLLANQCGKLDELPWQMMDKEGAVLASGTAARLQNWRPIVTADATANAVAQNAAPLDLSRPADSAPLQHFDLPGGCHFRTWWDENGQSLFIPDDKALHCSTEGWLEGGTQLTLSSDGKQTPVPVTFFEGYPITQLRIGNEKLQVVAINNQRMVVTKADAPDSWLVLPFNPTLHVWNFTGTLLVKMNKSAAQDLPALKVRTDAVRKAWSPLWLPDQKINLLLIDALHADLADPAIGAWRSLN